MQRSKDKKPAKKSDKELFDLVVEKFKMGIMFLTIMQNNG